METRKLLVADSSASFCAALADALGGAYELRTCNDGLQAQALLESFQPDLLVTDLALPGLDGLSVLKAAGFASKRPKTLVTTRYTSPYIERAINEVGVDYLMMKPCDVQALAERIQDMSQSVCCSVPMPIPRTTTSNVLLALGVSVKHKGYQYLEIGIGLFEKDPQQSMTKALYPTLAKRYDTSRESIERAIRSAIQSAWDNRDEKVWRLYFQPCRNGMVPRPTNKVFIAALAEVLGNQERQRAQM